MSEDSFPSIDENNSEKRTGRINEKYLIKFTNENNKTISRNAKQTCKILQISSELDIDKKLAIISALEPSEYPILFIFIIEEQNLNFLNENQGIKALQLEEHLRKFGASRPMIIQQRFSEENKTILYYKRENLTKIDDIDQYYPEDFELYKQWKDILSSFYEEKLEQFEDELLKKLSSIKDSSIILRFLRTLNLPESFFETLVRFIAVSGSKADLLAVLDASFDDNGRILSDQAQNYIQTVFEDDESDEVESTSEKESDEEQDHESTIKSTKNGDSGQSILLTAVQHSNQDIIDFLIMYWTHLIQELPIEHQIRISSTAYDDNQLDVLCDLLEFSDFPFPKNLGVINHQLNHKRLQKIISERIKFHELIAQEDENEIKDFIENNLSLKFIYSPQNITAMKKAIDSQNYKIYYYLKSFGLCASEFRKLEEVLDEIKLNRANEQANVQKTESISDALRNTSKSVLILCTRALIHNRKVKKEDETKYRKHIKKWLEDINKIAGIMLDIAASCENVVIIFDFESKYVDRTAFRDNSLGLSSDTVSSRIFIGANLGDSKREQDIKGVLAHELCHYVMCLVYDNKFLPYYKYATDIRDKFDEIVKTIDKWSTNDQDPPYDECNGIISTVFTSYPENCFHYELIVRVVQILVLYNDQPEQSVHLQKKYQNLFDFWYNHVIPEINKYLQKNKVVIRINTTVELLSSLSKSNIKFKVSKDMEQLTKNRIIIAATNVSKLLLINIHKHLQEKQGSLLESQNVFIEPEKIKNAQVWKDLMHIYAKDVKLNIFVDCTKGYLNNLSSILKIEDFNFILVASNEEQLSKLKDICIKKKIKPIIMDINYNWSDLTENSQTMLLESKVTFQNNPKTSLIELLSKNMNTNQDEFEKINKEFSNIINDHVFNQLIDRQKISVNSNVDDSGRKNFEILFRNRDFLKKGIKFKNEISQEILISVTASNKYVLISDIAGSGKSWVVKNISKIIVKQDSTRWVTYVDLKEYIEKFKEQSENLEFANYFVENILKQKSKFEEEIFKKLYENGKVSIIFDAFDEIAPDCAEFVANLAKSFEFNDGNQLWIVTRDYFEVNLQQKLEVNNVYKLNEFTEEDGINFIVASWILMDQTIYSFENHVENSTILTKYRQKATKIVRKVTMSKDQSIGLPQLFSLIAYGFKDDNLCGNHLKGSNIFTQFVKIMYKRWLNKGQLREDANALSLDYKLNFKGLHQYFAILSLFPELIKKLFPDYDISEWPEVEIIAGGLLNKIGSTYSFIHETFREYFIADFIFKAIKETRIKKEIVNLIIKILTIQKYGIVRMFLNDFIDNHSTVMKNVQLKMEKFVEIFNNMENLSEYFTENLEHLAKCIIEVLKKGDYVKVKKIICDNISAVAANTKELKIFSAFTEFLFSYLRLDDLKDMISNQNILHKIIGSELDVETVELFVLKLDEKVGREFIQRELQMMPSEPENGNIIYHFGKSENLSKNKAQKYFQIIQKYLDDTEIVELMDKCNEGGQTILKILVENTKNFNPFLEGAECIFTDQNLFQKFKKIVKKIDSNGQNILHWSAEIKNIDFHTSVWKLIEKTFENQEEFGTFALQKSKSSYNFLHLLVNQSNAEIIEFTIQKLKENLSESDYHEILRAKGNFFRNLLQIAVRVSNEIKIHQILWKNISDSCKSNQEFLEIVEEIDEDESGVFNLAAGFTTIEVFEFMEKELEKIASHDEIRKLFIKLGNESTNLLQSAVIYNRSLEFHRMLWTIIQKYFNSSEILEFTKNCDIYRENLLIHVIKYNKKEVSEFTWKEAKETLNNIGLITEENKENIQKCEKIMKNISGPSQLGKDEREFLKLQWIKNENSEASLIFHEAQWNIQKSVERNLNICKFENLQFFVTDENVENHEKLWEKIVQIYKTTADLKNVLSEKTKTGTNFINLLVIYNRARVIEFTINKFKENLNESDYHDILRSKGQHGRNLLQLAAVYSKEVKTHQILWKELHNSCNTNKEFLQIIGEADEQGNNVFCDATAHTTSEVLEFLEKELEKIASRDEIRKLFTKLGYLKINLLKSAAIKNKSLELQKTLWILIKKYFNSSEILEFIKHLDVKGNNLLTIAKNWSTKEILELTWTEVKEVLTVLYTDTETIQNIKYCEKTFQKIIANTKVNKKDKEVEEDEFLKLEWIKIPNSGSSNLFDKPTQDVLRKSFNVQTFDDLQPIINNKNVLNHEILWDHLVNTFKNQQDLAKLFTEKNKDGDSFLHLLIIYNTVDVIQFTLQKLKENLSESNYQEILRLKGISGRSLLQFAAVGSKKVKIYQILWKELRDSCKSDAEFLKILGEVDEDGGNNVFNIAAFFTTSEVFKFMQKELEKVEHREEIKKLLINLGYENRNLLQSAARENKSVELHEALWEIIQKYFSPSEILQFIQHRDVFGWNVLLNVITENSKEIKEMTWDKVKKLLIAKGYENNENIGKCAEIMKKDKKVLELTKEEKEILNLDWIGSKNSIKLFEDSIQLIIQKDMSDISLKDLKSFMADENIENHRTIWKYLEKSFKNYEGLKKILFEKDKFNNNYIHYLIILNKSDVIEFTIQKLKAYLKNADYQEILRSEGQLRRNLLQRAASNSIEVKTHQILWQTVRDSCNSNEEFLDILRQVDINGSDVLNLAAGFTTSEVFEFIDKELEKIAPRDEIKKLFIKLGHGKQNLLQAAAAQNKSLELHKTLWKILQKYFSSSELLELITLSGEDNLLKLAIERNVNEVLEFTWQEVKGILSELDSDTETVQKIDRCEKVVQRVLKSDIKSCTEEEMEILNILNGLKI